jgi:hypothetical protein
LIDAHGTRNWGRAVPDSGSCYKYVLTGLQKQHIYRVVCSFARGNSSRCQLRLARPHCMCAVYPLTGHDRGHFWMVVSTR